MAIYHLSVKAISRSEGRTATAAAAYRAGCLIADKRTGDVHDYTRKGGVQSATIVLPDGAAAWAQDRGSLWNAAELAERRKDACVAREFEVALPNELSALERQRLALDFAKEMANREGCAVDVAIHAPGKEGDNRNHHAHILRTTRKVEASGLGDKLDTEKAGRKRVEDLEAMRQRWADLTNERLRENGIEAKVDHRSYADQGVDQTPSKHLGVAATGFERRTDQVSRVRTRHNEAAIERLALAKQEGELERELDQAEHRILDLSNDLERAKQQQQAMQLLNAEQGMADFRASFAAHLKAQAEAKALAEQQRKQAEEAQREAEFRRELQAQKAEEAKEAKREAARQRERDKDGGMSP